MSEISAILSAAAQHSSRRLASAAHPLHFIAYGIPDVDKFAAQKCKADDKHAGQPLLWPQLQSHIAVEQLQIRRRPALTLTEIAIENTATDGKC
jgi:hypothetical protein